MNIDNVDNNKLRVILGSDHAGFDLKESLEEDLRAEGYEVEDLGTHSHESVDYPDIARNVAEAVAGDSAVRGILVCGTGIGMAITANKIKGIRAAACSDSYSARMARAHNNANILCIGGRVVGPGLALEVVNAFLETDFEGERHQRRIDKIKAIEEC